MEYLKSLVMSGWGQGKLCSCLKKKGLELGGGGWTSTETEDYFEHEKGEEAWSKRGLTRT